MKKVKQYKRWGIYQVTDKEKKEYDCGFNFAVIHPDIMSAPHPWLEPGDTDMECETLEEAISWIDNY